MAKKAELANSFGSTRKRRTNSVSEDEIEKITGEVHKQEEKPNQRTPPKRDTKNATESVGEEPTIKTSLDFPAQMYEDMKIMLIRRKLSMRQYILDLVGKDMKKFS